MNADLLETLARDNYSIYSEGNAIPSHKRIDLSSEHDRTFIVYTPIQGSEVLIDSNTH